jgi:hypothetical protein
LPVFDLSRPEHFDGQAARLALRRREANERNLNLAIARQSHLSAQGKPRCLLNRLKERNRQFA